MIRERVTLIRDTPMSESSGGSAWPVPVRWPSAWLSLRTTVLRRAAFVLAVAVLTATGIVAVGDPSAQWWIPLLPAVLLAGPISRLGGIPRRLRRATRRGRLATMPGRVHPGPVTSHGQTVRLVTDGGVAVGVPVAGDIADALATGHVGDPAVLVWVNGLRRRRPAALVLAGPSVAYLDRVPAGARSVMIGIRPSERPATVVRPRR